MWQAPLIKATPNKDISIRYDIASQIEIPSEKPRAKARALCGQDPTVYYTGRKSRHTSEQTVSDYRNCVRKTEGPT